MILNWRNTTSLASAFSSVYNESMGESFTTMVFPTTEELFFIPSAIGLLPNFPTDAYPSSIVFSPVLFSPTNDYFASQMTVNGAGNLCRILAGDFMQVNLTQKETTVPFYAGDGMLFDGQRNPLLILGFLRNRTFDRIARKMIVDISVFARKDLFSKYIAQKIVPSLVTESFPKIRNCADEVIVEARDLSEYVHKAKNPTPKNLDKTIKQILAEHQDTIAMHILK